ncbi:MAG: amino acid permease [Planctomycetota bacterium]
MSDVKPHALAKTLGLLDIYAITTAGFFSAGFFVLPALAFEVGGPAAVFAYPLAAILMAPSMLSIAELATALPRAGGPYFFLDRSLGPAIGTIGGIGTWLALLLKSCFAFIGLGAYLAIMPYVGNFIPADPVAKEWTIKGLAVALTVGFALLNLRGGHGAARIQNALVIGLAIVLAIFMISGFAFLMTERGGALTEEHFDHWLNPEFGIEGEIAAVGLVFFTSIGILKLVSVSEEIAKPGRNIPLAIGLSILTATIVNAAGVFLMIAVLDGEPLAHSYTPAYDAATFFMDPAWLPASLGLVLIALAAIAAFAGSGNAGILGASRYPLAMSRDRLISPWFGKTSSNGVPVTAVLFTSGVMIAVILTLDAKSVAKLASAFVLVVFALLNMAVFVMRESKIESYDPDFRSPLYPWMQLLGIAISIWLISQMGLLPILFSLGVVVVATAWYFYFGRARTERHGAIFHWFALLGKLQHDELDDEFRQIMVEKGARADDPFDDVVMRASVIDSIGSASYPGLIAKASEVLARRLPRSAEFITDKFIESGKFGFAPISHGVALPHFRSADLDRPELVIVRTKSGVQAALTDAEAAAAGTQRVHALFLLVSPENDPGVHLRILAHLAGRIDEDGFMDAWLAGHDEQELKEILLRDERFFSLEVCKDDATAELIDRSLRNLELPENTLVAMVRRDHHVFVPRGGTTLHGGDRLTIIGDPKGITEVRKRYRAAQVRTTDAEKEVVDSS